MNSCDFFIKQVYCLGLHFVTRLKYSVTGLFFGDGLET